MTPMQLAYLAGALDHKGTIRIAKGCGHGTYMRALVSITTHSSETLQAFVDAFGGNVRVGASLRNSLRWQRTDSNAEHILRTLRPFMVVRAKLVDEILAWVDERNSTRAQRVAETLAKATAKKERAEARAKAMPVKKPSWSGLLPGRTEPRIRGARRVGLL